MAFARPTLSELKERIEQDMLSRLPITAPVLRRSVVGVLAWVLAGVAHLLHGHIEYLVKQVFPDLCDDENLLRHAALRGMSLKPGEFATGAVEARVTATTEIEHGAVLVRSDGVEYEYSGETQELVGYEGEGAVTHVLDVVARLPGQDGNAPAGTTLTWQSPPVAMEAEATVDSDGLGGGADQETMGSLRERVLERLRSAPHGGAAADYIAWAKEVPGVTRAWSYPLEDGPGTVVVRFVRDDDDDLIPSEGEVETVQAYIDELAPATAEVTVLAPVPAALDCELEITPDTSATRAAVIAGIEDLLRREAKPGGRILLSHLRNAIGDADGVTDYHLVSPTADFVPATGHIAVLGEVEFS